MIDFKRAVRSKAAVQAVVTVVMLVVNVVNTSESRSAELKATEFKVMSSVAILEAYNRLVPVFEAASGHKVVTEWVPTVEMMKRLLAGEAPDLAIMASNGVEQLVREGKFVSEPRVVVARSGIGVAIKAGAAKPDIGSANAVKAALIAAGSVAYSTGPSGAYLAQLFERMGLTATLAPKLKIVQGVPVGDLVARGDAEIGFQQVPELLTVKGIDYIGTLPAEIQQVTAFVAGVPVEAAKRTDQARAAQALLAFFKTPASATVFRKTGMEPG